MKYSFSPRDGEGSKARDVNMNRTEWLEVGGCQNTCLIYGSFTYDVSQIYIIGLSQDRISHRKIFAKKYLWIYFYKQNEQLTSILPC